MTVPSIFEGCWYLLPNFVLNQYQTEAKYINANQFTSNYYKNYFSSILIGSSCYILSGISIALLVKGANALSIAATAISAIYLGVFWNIKGNQPFLLAVSALEAISEKDEGSALEYIKNGADLSLDFGGEMFEFNALPLIPLRLYKAPPKNILTYAAEANCEGVVNYLLSLEVYSKYQLTTALARTGSIKIAQKLIDTGAPLSFPDRRFSPLYIQILSLCTIPNLSTPLVIEALEIICLLLNSGAKLELHDCSKDEAILLLHLKDIASNYKSTQVQQLINKISYITQKSGFSLYRKTTHL